MSAHRFLFYVPTANATLRRLSLPDDEHHHASRALRLRAGDEIHVTNGAGLIQRCRVIECAREGTRAEVLEVVMDAAAPAVTLALALIRKDRFEQAVEQCVELGVNRFVPFVSDRCQAQTYGARAIDRLRKIGLAAMKQSFRAALPEIAEPVTFEELLGPVAKAAHAVVADPNGSPARPCSERSAVTMVVGPEAGLTDGELDRLRDAGAGLVSLSRGRLRAETAAVALATALLLPA